MRSKFSGRFVENRILKWKNYFSNIRDTTSSQLGNKWSLQIFLDRKNYLQINSFQAGPIGFSIFRKFSHSNHYTEMGIKKNENFNTI